MNQAISIEKKGKMAESDSLSFYHHELSRAPHIMALLVSATLVTDKGPVIRSASDYSYSATSYAGPGYRIVGDAAGERFMRLMACIALTHWTSLLWPQRSLTRECCRFV